MILRLPTKLLFILCGLFFCQISSAISLGALSITSTKEERLEAKIMILMSAQELKTLGKLEAQLADQGTFEKFGVVRPSDELQPNISIQKDGAGKPIAIRIQFSKTVLELEKAFSDLVIELSWSSGKLTRVYTILNTQAKELQVREGDNLVGIVSQITPQLAGVEFNQVLVAIYRMNPKAFYAGNINRLKQGETLILPSATMAASIPIQEAQEFAAAGAKDYRQRQLNRSTDSVLKSNNRSYSQATLKDDFKDRLKIGSSQTESEQALALAKFNEDFIAQQKMLEQAQQRISELERNIADIKEINSKKTTALPTIDPSQYGIVIGVLALIGIFLYGVLRRSKPDELEVTKPLDPPVNRSEVPSWQIPATATTPFIIDQKNRDDSPDDAEVIISSDAFNAAEQAMPKNVQELFSSIDLNLVPAVANPVTRDQNSLDSSKIVNSPENSGYKLDLGINSPPDSSSETVPKVQLNTDEQKVRLNLARSYIKIKDFETARILLNDLVDLGASADQDVFNQASALLLEIS
jgi:FimV-like protein